MRTVRNSTIGDFSNNNRPLKLSKRPNIPLNRPHKPSNRPHIPANRPHKLLNRPHIPKNENALFAKEVKSSANRAVLCLFCLKVNPATLKIRINTKVSNFNTLYQNCSPKMERNAYFNTNAPQPFSWGAFCVLWGAFYKVGCIFL